MFQWAAFTPGGTLVTCYYDRQYGSDEFTGNMDVSVSTSQNLSTFTVEPRHLLVHAAADAVPRHRGSVFFGDYAGVAAVSGAHPLWSDTRNPDAFLCPGTAAPGVPPAVCTAARAERADRQRPADLHQNDAGVLAAPADIRRPAPRGAGRRAIWPSLRQARCTRSPIADQAPPESLS